MRRARPDVVVMHPGPMNRGIEIDAAVADGPNSAVLDQVAHGLSIRMAVLFLCLTARAGTGSQDAEDGPDQKQGHAD